MPKKKTTKKQSPIKLNKAQLKKELDRLGLDYKTRASNKELEKILKNGVDNTPIYIKNLGRPTKYKKEYPRKLIEFFVKNRAYKKEVIKVEYFASGEIKKQEYKLMCGDIPFFSKFAREVVGCDEDTIVNWAKAKNEDGSPKYAEFFGAYNMVKKILKEFLINQASAGLIPPATFIFIAKNITDMVDKTQVSTPPGEDLTVKFAGMNDEELNKDLANRLIKLIKGKKI